MSPRFPFGKESERLARANTAPGAVVTGKMSIPEYYSQCLDWLLRCVAEAHQVTSIIGFEYAVDSHWRRISSRLCFPPAEWTVGNIPDLRRPRTLDEATSVANYIAAVADMEGVANTTDVSDDSVFMTTPIMRCDEAGISSTSTPVMSADSTLRGLGCVRNERCPTSWGGCWDTSTPRLYSPERGWPRVAMWHSRMDRPSGRFRTSAQCQCLR